MGLLGRGFSIFPSSPSIHNQSCKHPDNHEKTKHLSQKVRFEFVEKRHDKIAIIFNRLNRICKPSTPNCPVDCMTDSQQTTTGDKQPPLTNSKRAKTLEKFDFSARISA